MRGMTIAVMTTRMAIVTVLANRFPAADMAGGMAVTIKNIVPC